ncbi:MAG: hypothetical protein HYZ39_10230 [Mycolicibacterium cosmeticum]|nr:hypothetical protein [Mycolicibacterium cosmeticum]
MITEKDIDFHIPPTADYLWAETTYFAITIPEERLMVSVYVVYRKGLGVMSADVTAFGALADTRAECLYHDNHQHLPAPETMTDMTTPTGLRIRCSNPRDYRIDYVGFDDTELHVDFKGLMEPFDIRDPMHSPKATADSKAAAESSGLGTAYNGHFDLTGRITGTLKLRGKEYEVDCIETMDHSWGPRPETHLADSGWQHAHFGEDLVFHWIVLCDYSKPVGEQHALAHGYVLDDGVVHGLTALKLRTIRTGVVTVAHELEVTDVRGKVWNLYGSAEIGAPWVCYISALVYVAMMRWTLPDGRVGYGVSQEAQSMQGLTAQRGKSWTEQVSKVTS